jgi:hypothetical protein
MQLIDRLPMTVESLKTSKLGKIVVKLVKDPPTPGESPFFFVRRVSILGHCVFFLVRCAFICAHCAFIWARCAFFSVHRAFSSAVCRDSQPSSLRPTDAAVRETPLIYVILRTVLKSIASQRIHVSNVLPFMFAPTLCPSHKRNRIRNETIKTKSESCSDQGYGVQRRTSVAPDGDRESARGCSGRYVIPFFMRSIFLILILIFLASFLC